MNYIEVNGVGLRYELSGAGEKTLVLVHEMGGTLESWDEVVPRLTASRRVLRYDTRGAGMSQKIRGELARRHDGRRHRQLCSMRSVSRARSRLRASRSAARRRCISPRAILSAPAPWSREAPRPGLRRTVARPASSVRQGWNAMA